jgi:ribose 5-phosphate isomerase B
LFFNRLAIGSDHRGFYLKRYLSEYFKSIGYVVDNCGPEDDQTSVDYPDFAEKVVSKVLKFKKCFGILLCHSGVGMNIAANRYKGIRSVWCDNEAIAILSREHNNANVICFGSHFVDSELAKNCANIFASTEFTDKRHLVRIKKLDLIASLKTNHR